MSAGDVPHPRLRVRRVPAAGPRQGRSASRLLLAGPAGRSAVPLGLLFALVLGVGSPVLWAAVATASAPTTLVVRLDALSPAVVTARTGKDVVLVGTVTNTGSAPAAAVTLRAVLSTEGLSLRPDVGDWADGSSVVDGHEVARGTSAALTAGSSRTIRLTLPSAALRNPSPYAVLPLAIEASSTTPGVLTASVHTFVLWHQKKEYERLGMGFLLPLTLGPDPTLFGLPGDAARAAAWAHAVGPGSSAARVLAVADAAGPSVPITLAVDPAVLGPRLPGSGPAAGTSSTVTDPARAVTDAFAGRLRATAGRRTVWALPYADPDVSAVLAADARNRPLGALLSAPDGLSGRLGVPVRSDIAWPADGVLGASRERSLRALYGAAPLGAAVLAAAGSDGSTDVSDQAPSKSSTGLPLLGFDRRLSAAFAAAAGAPVPGAPRAGVASGTTPVGTATTATAARQLFLADSLAMLQELPGTSRSVLVAAPRGMPLEAAAAGSLFAAVRSAPWLQPVPTSELLRLAQAARPSAASPLTSPAATAVPSPAAGTSETSTSATVGASPGATGSAGSVSASAAPPASPLTPGRIAAIGSRRRSIDGAAGLLEGSTAYRPTWLEAEDQLLSTRWRGHTSAWNRLQATVAGEVKAVLGAVSVKPSAVNFFADQGVLQVTVVNTLDKTVQGVRLRLVPGSPRLRIDAQPAPLRIGARSRTTVRVQVTAVAAGLVRVDARLTTPNGTPLGARAQLKVRVQPTGAWPYWVLGGVAGLTLVAGILRSLRRGSRGSRATPQSRASPGSLGSRMHPGSGMDAPGISATQTPAHPESPNALRSDPASAPTAADRST